MQGAEDVPDASAFMISLCSWQLSHVVWLPGRPTLYWWQDKGDVPIRTQPVKELDSCPFLIPNPQPFHHAASLQQDSLLEGWGVLSRFWALTHVMLGKTLFPSLISPHVHLITQENKSGNILVSSSIKFGWFYLPYPFPMNAWRLMLKIGISWESAVKLHLE